MLVHKCDACGKIFPKVDYKRVYEITKRETDFVCTFSDKTRIEVDICDECYSAVVEFLERSASNET